MGKKVYYDIFLKGNSTTIDGVADKEIVEELAKAWDNHKDGLTCGRARYHLIDDNGESYIDLSEVTAILINDTKSRKTVGFGGGDGE